jgi:cell division protein FtsW
MLALLGLCVVGVLMVFSSSFVKAFETYRDPYFYLKQHLVRLAIGSFCFMLAYRIDYHRLQRISILPLLICVIALIWVLVAGTGIRRWLNVFGVLLQPSEFARIALIVYLADWIARNAKEFRTSFKAYGFTLIMIVIVSGLVVIEPSYSAAAMIAASAGAVLVLAGTKWRYLLATLFPIVPVAAHLGISQPYRLTRWLSFLDPGSDPLGSGYQSLQSKIAVGSGQIWGLGFGMSGQKSHFLPEAHCDFVFSIFCEERGFIGAVFVLFLFIIFLWRGIKIAMQSPDQFGYLLASGLTLSIALLAFVNIGVTLGLLPVTGLPLPFISYGGSALIANLTACGIIMNVSRHAIPRGKSR